MGWMDDYKPTMAMIVLQFSYATISLGTRAALLEGMSPRVFVVYRQAIATLVVAPIAFFLRSNSSTSSLGLRSFFLIFFMSLIGITINQNIFFEGLFLASSSMGSAMGNLVPAVTFILASFFGLEKVDIQSLRSIAKIFGTISCVGGAISMAFLRGPKLLNSSVGKKSFSFGIIADTLCFYNSINNREITFNPNEENDNWLLGCLYLFGSCCCWSLWLILQVPVSKVYHNFVSLSAWMCCFSTFQSAIVAFFLEPDLQAWKFTSNLQLACCFYSGIIGSGVSFFLQAWCISRRGPLFSAMFNPLCTVIVSILAAILLHEEIYTGSLIGAFGVIIGLYIVLWGKAKDHEEIKEDFNKKSQLIIDEPFENNCCKIDLKEPLLAHK